MQLIELTSDHSSDIESFSESYLCNHSISLSWKNIIEKTFGHRAHYLGCMENDQLTGILPLFHFKSLLFGSSLISSPYVTGPGLVAKNEEAEKFLIAEAVKLAKEKKVSYIELRNRTPLLQKNHDIPVREHKVTMVLELAENEEAQFKAFSSRLRNKIRRPAKEGFHAEVVSGANFEKKHIDGFYAVFSENMRDLGTPVYPKDLIINTLNEFADKATLVTVFKGDDCAAGVVTIGSKDSVEVPWASCLRKYNSAYANMLLYWESIRAACNGGYKYYDFGRSTVDGGTYKFKKLWGSQAKQLYWYYPLPDGKVPDVNPDNSKFSLMVNYWQKLPLGVSNVLGPLLTRNIP